MKLLIDIPESIYKDIKEIKIQYPRGSSKPSITDFYYELFKCIKRGQVVPEDYKKAVITMPYKLGYTTYKDYMRMLNNKGDDDENNRV